MKHGLPWIAALVLAGACGSRAERAQPGTATPLHASIATAVEENVADTFEAGGVVRPRLRATISSRMLAPVERVAVTAGTRVRAGQELVLLDARQVSSDAARATVLVDSARRGAEAAAADRQSAAAQLVLARKTHERMAALNASRSATQQELDEATAMLASAEGHAMAAEARAVEADRAVAAAIDAERSAGVVHTYATLTAPFDGVVTSRSVDPGTLATPGMPLLQLETDDRFSLETTIDEAWVVRLAVGAPIDVIVDAVAATPLAGRVEEVARALDSASHSVTVKIALPSLPALRSGMFGTARIPGEARRAIVVPHAAVLTRGQLSFVFVADRGIARLRLVRTAPGAAGRVVIVSGLAAGESYLAAPPAGLQDGQPVGVKG